MNDEVREALLQIAEEVANLALRIRELVEPEKTPAERLKEHYAAKYGRDTNTVEPED